MYNIFIMITITLLLQHNHDSECYIYGYRKSLHMYNYFLAACNTKQSSLQLYTLQHILYRIEVNPTQ